MKLAGHSFQFPTLTLEKACQVTAALDLPAIDIGALQGYAHLDPDEIEADPSATIRHVRQVIGQFDLAVSDFFPSFGQGFSERPLNDPNPDVRIANRRRFECFLSVASGIDSPGITLLPGVVDPGLGYKESLSLAVETLREYVEMAQEAGLRLSFEGHIGSIADTPERVLALQQHVPGLSVTLDYSHFVAQGIEPEAVDDLLPHAGHVHLRQARPGRVQVGAAEGILDFKEIIGKLRAVGYTGYLTVEYTWQDWEGCKNVDNVAESVIIRDTLWPILAARGSEQ